MKKNKRASILVEDKKGEQYSNGKQYLKFYIPISRQANLKITLDKGKWEFLNWSKN